MDQNLRRISMKGELEDLLMVCVFQLTNLLIVSPRIVEYRLLNPDKFYVATELKLAHF